MHLLLPCRVLPISVLPVSQVRVLAEAPDVLVTLGDCVDAMLGVMEERSRWV